MMETQKYKREMIDERKKELEEGWNKHRWKLEEKNEKNKKI
jgi:hypothetical protein